MRWFGLPPIATSRMRVRTHVGTERVRCGDRRRCSVICVRVVLLRWNLGNFSEPRRISHDTGSECNKLGCMFVQFSVSFVEVVVDALQPFLARCRITAGKYTIFATCSSPQQRDQLPVFLLRPVTVSSKCGLAVLFAAATKLRASETLRDL